MLRRLFALAVIVVLVGGGLYYWKYQTTGVAPRSLEDLGEELGDVKVTAQVKAALALNRNLKPYTIGVSSEDGVITLRGDVPSAELKGLALRLAEAVPDVRQVVSHVRVAGDAAPAGSGGRTLGESLDDHALEVQVRLAFSLHREMKGADVEVAAYRKSVTLRGRASAGQRVLAQSLARDTSGVEDVKDEIRVEP